mmetsp:Transcript_38166/g.122671  ORF Transcript_38166/g.122671 Transcript_38166/m.122671 type:complete len:210 (-) Transcript_38166:608-1237(-)
MVVRLEHHFANAGARQPLRLESLQLHRSLWVVVPHGLRRVHGVQGKQGLPALESTHLQGERQVLEVQSRGGLEGGRDSDGAVLLKDQATQPLRHDRTTEPLGGDFVVWDRAHLPTDVELLSPGPLQRRLLPLAGNLAQPHLLGEHLRHALAVHQQLLTALLFLGIDVAAQWKPALPAQESPLTIGIFDLVCTPTAFFRRLRLLNTVRHA